MHLAAAVLSALKSHSGIRSVHLVGSRAEDRATEASDWDFLVETTDFPAVARDLPQLVGSLHPIAQQWDLLSECACYMLTLPGPIKVDLIFAGVPHKRQEPWEIASDTLAAVDAHFWDWMLWLTSKLASERGELIGTELTKMWDHILRPLGVGQPPRTLEEATTQYLAARDQWERRLRLSVPRDLEREILPRIRHRSN
jgi:predicted nucleotidyltransferase